MNDYRNILLLLLILSIPQYFPLHPFSSLSLFLRLHLCHAVLLCIWCYCVVLYWIVFCIWEGKSAPVWLLGLLSYLVAWSQISDSLPQTHLKNKIYPSARPVSQSASSSSAFFRLHLFRIKNSVFRVRRRRNYVNPRYWVEKRRNSVNPGYWVEKMRNYVNHGWLV